MNACECNDPLARWALGLSVLSNILFAVSIVICVCTKRKPSYHSFIKAVTA